MITTRKAGLALAALFSAVLVVPALADGASDFQANTKKASSTLDQLSALLNNVHTRVASGESGSEATQQVSATEDTMKCPVCGMTMTAKATASNSKSVMIKGKTYFCCAGCDMSKIADKPTPGVRANRAGGARRTAPKKP